MGCACVSIARIEAIYAPSAESTTACALTGCGVSNARDNGSDNASDDASDDLMGDPVSRKKTGRANQITASEGMEQGKHADADANADAEWPAARTCAPAPRPIN